MRIRQVGVSRARIAAWCSFIQRLEHIREMLCQFWQWNSDALLALELTVQEADNQRGMIGLKKPGTRRMLQVIGKLVILHNCLWEYIPALWFHLFKKLYAYYKVLAAYMQSSTNVLICQRWGRTEQGCCIFGNKYEMPSEAS